MKKRISVFIMALAFIAGAFFMPVKAIDKGIDVYEYSNIQDYDRVKNSGITTVIQKATEGNTYNDKLLNYRADHLKNAGFKVGYYHFARNNGDVIGQAKHFLSQVKGLKSDTVYWLDIENEGSWNKSIAVSFTNTFKSYMSTQGYKMGIYTGEAFYKDYLQGNIDPSIPLWIANYSKAPAGYPNSSSWQYSQYGQTSGIIGNTDMDYFIKNIYLNNKPAPDLVKPQTFYSSAVATAQYQLNRTMNSKLTVNGILDQKTIDTLANFQNLMGITARGNVTADTQCALNNILTFPNCHIGGGNKYAVKYLQYRFAIPVDGVFGQQTRNLVSNFQIGHKLQATGVADKATWLQLFK